MIHLELLLSPATDTLPLHGAAKPRSSLRVESVPAFRADRAQSSLGARAPSPVLVCLRRTHRPSATPRPSRSGVVADGLYADRVTQESFQSFVEDRLDARPRPSGNDAQQPRYWVGAGEVMLDILLASTNPAQSDLVLNKIGQDAAAGDPIAPIASQLLNMWMMKQASGDLASLGDQVDDEMAPTMVRAFRALTLLYLGAADADRVATLDTVLTFKMGQGHLLATVLKAMLDTALKDLSGLANAAVKRTMTAPATSNPSASAQPAPTAAKSGCYVATAVYGSYDCPEVWVLRRFRDQSMAKRAPGRFMVRAYYTLSPTAVRMVGHRKWFTAIIRPVLDAIVTHLRRAGFAQTPYIDA